MKEINEISKKALKKYRFLARQEKGLAAKSIKSEKKAGRKPEEWLTKLHAKRAKGQARAEKKLTEEVKPMLYNHQPDVDRLNALLDQMMARPFKTSFIAVQSIRAALDLFGITLPKLEVEQDAEKPSSIGALTMLHAGKLLPVDPDCEYAFQITPANAGPEDTPVDLHLYIAIDRDEKTGHYDGYAQVVTKKELNKLLSMDIKDMDHDYPEQVGDDSGETKWNQRIRHTGTTGGGDAFNGEHG